MAFFKEEQKGTVDYKGYIPSRRQSRRRGPERRVDPDGGGRFTRREFVRYYNGTAEWDAAALPDPSLRGDQKHLLTISFSWDGVMKSIGSSFIGVSPEFEFALYTMMFMCGEEKNDVEIGGYKVRVTCYSMGRAPHLKIGTCFPACRD
jgi:hypothetical protein|tara:strand:+ start:1242 stop:1685 length:444 start_codon:yes stop_codon:yes gene_type:complete